VGVGVGVQFIFLFYRSLNAAIMHAMKEFYQPLKKALIIFVFFIL